MVNWVTELLSGLWFGVVLIIGGFENLSHRRAIPTKNVLHKSNFVNHTFLLPRTCLPQASSRMLSNVDWSLEFVVWSFFDYRWLREPQPPESYSETYKKCKSYFVNRTS